MLDRGGSHGRRKLIMFRPCIMAKDVNEGSGQGSRNGKSSGQL